MRGDGGHRLVVAGVDALRVGTVATTNGIAKAIDKRFRGEAGNADVMGRRYERSCPTGTPVPGRVTGRS
jgi:hypothetical protein